MLYRKKFSKFLEESFLSDNEAALYLGCSISALRLWKFNENTAPKESVHHLEEYVEKLTPFYNELKNVFDVYKNEELYLVIDNIIHKMQENGFYYSTIMNILSKISIDVSNSIKHNNDSNKSKSLMLL